MCKKQICGQVCCFTSLLWICCLVLLLRYFCLITPKFVPSTNLASLCCSLPVLLDRTEYGLLHLVKLAAMCLYRNHYVLSSAYSDGEGMSSASQAWWYNDDFSLITTILIFFLIYTLCILSFMFLEALAVCNWPEECLVLRQTTRWIL